MTYYIYALVDPEGSQTGYIGLSIVPEKRFWRHISEAAYYGILPEERRPSDKNRWPIGLLLSGIAPLMMELDILPEGTSQVDALRIENEWIVRWRALGWELVNRQPAKEPVRLTPEERHAILVRCAANARAAADNKRALGFAVNPWEDPDRSQLAHT